METEMANAVDADCEVSLKSFVETDPGSALRFR
jgi:hypothetical protein